MKKLSIAVVLLVFHLLDNCVCLVDVTCESRIGASEEPKSSTCYIRNFPSTNPNQETYNFHINYARRTDIKEVEFLPTATIESIPSSIFDIFPNLQHLHMATNLRELNGDSFRNAISLTSLDLGGNKIKIVPHNVFASQSSLHALSTLSLSRNEISEIEANSFRGLNRLFELNLQHNRLKTLYRNTFVGLPMLGTIDLQDNAIEIIENGAFDLPALEVLYLGENKLQRLSDVTFGHLPAIKSIKLNNNELGHIGRSLYRLSTATFISLEGNHVQDIDLVAFAAMPSLKRLTLTQSGFTFTTTKIEADQQLNSPLERLEIGDNNLSDATELNKLRIFPKLKFLNLNGNPFTDLDIGGNRTMKDILPSLEMLALVRLKVDGEQLAAIGDHLKASHVIVLRGNDDGYEYD